VASLTGFWVLDWLYIGTRQARSYVARGNAQVYADPPSAHRVPVVLIPGILETWQLMRPLADLLAENGHPVHVMTGLRHNLGPIPEMARRVERYLEQHDLEDIVIVSHSKGGLIGKYLMVESPHGDHVRAMITVNTPFAGSVYARLSPTRHLRDFHPEDVTLSTLHENLEANARITAISTVFDPVIPAWGGLECARNIKVHTVGHFRVLGDPQLQAIVVEAAARADEAGPRC
jgi:triacylglycerol lipase